MNLSIRPRVSLRTRVAFSERNGKLRVQPVRNPWKQCHNGVITDRHSYRIYIQAEASLDRIGPIRCHRGSRVLSSHKSGSLQCLSFANTRKKSRVYDASVKLLFLRYVNSHVKAFVQTLPIVWLMESQLISQFIGLQSNSEVIKCLLSIADLQVIAPKRCKMSDKMCFYVLRWRAK